MPQRQPVPVSRLALVASASTFQDPREPKLRIGDRIRLNSGGPVGLVVEIDSTGITLAWPGGETTLPAACVHRARD